MWCSYVYEKRNQMFKILFTSKNIGAHIGLWKIIIEEEVEEWEVKPLCKIK